MQLPVLNNPGPHTPDTGVREVPAGGLSTASAEALAAALRGHGRVRAGRHERLLYATDASMYQVEPLGVVVPTDAEGVSRAVSWCAESGVPILPRGGGTSLAGQCTNHAVVIDTSASLRRLGPVEEAGEWKAVWAEAGCVPDEINAELARRGAGLFFAPDPATVAQACIGGCIGNNASGSRSIKYGRTVDSLLAIDAVLSNGVRATFEPGAGRKDAVALKLAEGAARIVRANERLVRERYPKTLRRNAGYALDMVLSQLDRGIEPADLDLTRLLCGSEGTLAVTVAAKLKLWALPKAKGLALVSFASVDAAIEAVPGLLTTGVSAVELVDDVVIEAALLNIECREYVKAFPLVNGKPPAAVLYVEYHEPSADVLGEKLAGVARTLPGGTPIRLVTDAPGMADAWKLRKAGEPLLHGLPGDRKPLTFIEDNAVPPERLGEFVRSLRAVVEREGTRAAFWAHASVGVLHVRPLLDPHDEADLQKLQRIALEAADLAKACGGVMSGEHGDGRVRGPLLERFYGPELMRAFREVKSLFDPRGVLNPGNEVAPGPLPSIIERTRIAPHRHGGSHHGPKPAVPAVSTYYEYADQHGFDGAVEQCNGAGVCRKQSGGTMCPSYRGTADERHSTRGRGNALRLAITGQSAAPGESGPAWSDPETIKTLDLCLSCKACKAECPSNVDVARLKAEYTAQRYRQNGAVPLGALATGHVRTLNMLGSLTPGLANWAAATGLGKWVARRAMGIDTRRPLPRFARSLYRQWNRARPRTTGPAVAIFGDCFTVYNEPRIGLAARRVLERLGYRVDLPAHGCCGRSMISVGMLPQAIETIDRTVEQLRPLIEDDSVKAILFMEPSCLSAVKDDWLQLKCRSQKRLREQLAAKSMLVEEFVDRQWEAHPNRPSMQSGAQERVALHAHCHQKALWGAGSSGNVLKRLLGDRLTTLQTGCCGMAGSFGYDAKKYDVSMTIANLPAHQGGVMKSIEAAGKGLPLTVCATGTSCRHQIADASAHDIEAIHPIELIDRLLA